MIQKLIFLVFTANFIAFLCCGSEAAIYKWKDKNGRTHFTDDPNRVPEDFLSDKMKLKPLPKIRTKNAKTEAEKKENEKKSSNPEETKPLKKKSSQLTETDKSAIESVVAFFEEDMPRYDVIYNRSISNGNAMKRKWKVLRNSVIATIPQKEALLEQISTADYPLLQEITSFLNQVISEDKKLENILPLLSDNTRPQINKLSKRLKNQTTGEKEYLRKIKAVLKRTNNS